ncbi:MAG: FAD/NAD(P)-binding protein [Nanoarchaeota archaeon]|nr:FAD/NAD(P)-binding protein [Nanoarchaeota archaeon]
MWFAKKENNEYETKKYVIDSIVKYTDDIWLFKINCNLNPKPGQFVQVSVPGIGEAPISCASYDDKQLLLLIRNVGSVTQSIFKLNIGDKIELRGPYGNGYPMDKLNGNNLIIIGGGTGTAPPHSVIDYVEKNKQNYKEVYIFMGFRTPDDELFIGDIEKWSKDFKVEFSVDKAPEDFHGNICLVTSLIENAFKEGKLKPENTKAVICGPPIMMKCIIDMLKHYNFDENSIYVSMERHMKCGVGKCGHCMVNGKYCCQDGPVFKYSEVKDVKE